MGIYRGITTAGLLLVVIILSMWYLGNYNKVKGISKNVGIFYEPVNSTKTNPLPEGFVYLNENEPNGPITLNRNNDDGTKRNIYKMIRKEDDLLDEEFENFKGLKDELKVVSKYICELPNDKRPEVQKGQYLSCPKHYTITIDDAFFGRYAHDETRCLSRNEVIEHESQCGYNPIKEMKELCEGREYCTVVIRDNIYQNKCKSIPKYMHVEYHCIKKPKLEKPKITIVQFYNGINENSLEENSINEFYQYANIHGYDYQFHKYNWVPTRQIYFMKIYLLTNLISNGLKEGKKNEWIFLLDLDTFLSNPSIKLETFLPEDSKIHFVPAFDYTGIINNEGINAGLFFIQIHEWSLTFLMRAITYPYFKSDMVLRLREQTTLNNVLIEGDEYDHFVVLPPEWFNHYYGEFIAHLMAGGKDSKNRKLRSLIKYIKAHPEKYSKTNKQLREEVLAYYAKPRYQQYKITLQA